MTLHETLTKGEHTRREIIQAAYTLFLEKGYSGTSIRQIADQADIAPAGIYNHFAGKEEIFAAVFLERHPYLEVLPILEAAQGENLETLLRNIAQRMIDVLAQRPDFLNLMFIEMIELKGSHLPALVEKVYPRLQNFLQRFTEAQVNNEMRPLPVPVILRAFLGLFISYAATEKMMGSLPPEFKTNNLDYFEDIFLHGILSPATSPTKKRPSHKPKA